MFPAFLKLPFLDMASSVWAMPEEQWIDDAATKEDIEMLEKECQGDSIIDRINFRKLTLDMWKRKEIELFVRELPGRTRVVFLGTSEQFAKIQWALWARDFYKNLPKEKVDKIKKQGAISGCTAIVL